MASKIATAITAKGLIHTGPCTLEKIVINSHSTGTFKLFDGIAETGTAFGGTYTPATGSSVIEIEAKFDTGLYIMTAGTINMTPLINGDPLR